MEYKTLGKTGIKVSGLCFGTMTFGSEADQAESARLFAAARDAGINFFDCANVYGAGAAEEILGALAAPCRDEIVLTTKVGFRTGPDANAAGASRRAIIQEAERSLRRLGTDRIDLYFIHTFDPDTPMEETLRALEDLTRAGKILHAGVSNWAAWQAQKALGIAALKNFAPIACLQPMYNLVKRQAEVEILPMAAAEGLGVICYSPMGGGFLSGKYAAADPARGTAEKAAGRIAENPRYAARYGEPSYLETARRFAELAAELGTAPATLAVAWVAANPAVTCPIVGARNMDQLRTVLPAADYPMTAELYARISALSPTPPPATDRNDERRA